MLVTLETMANDSRLPDQCNSFLHNKDQWRYKQVHAHRHTHRRQILSIPAMFQRRDDKCSLWFAGL